MAGNVSKDYLSHSCIQALSVFNQDFPKIGAATSNTPRPVTPATQTQEQHRSGTLLKDAAIRDIVADRSTSHICETQPLPRTKGSPPLKLLAPAHIADKKDVTPDSRSRRNAFPAPPPTPAPPIDLPTLLNGKACYCDPTSWYWHLLASHGHMIKAKTP